MFRGGYIIFSRSAPAQCRFQVYTFFFFLAETFLSEFSTHPLRSSVPFSVFAYIATIIDLPFYLIFSLLNTFIKIGYIKPIMRLGISITAYAFSGLFLDLLQ